MPRQKKCLPDVRTPQAYKLIHVYYLQVAFIGDDLQPVREDLETSSRALLIASFFRSERSQGGSNRPSVMISGVGVTYPWWEEGGRVQSTTLLAIRRAAVCTTDLALQVLAMATRSTRVLCPDIPPCIRGVGEPMEQGGVRGEKYEAQCSRQTARLAQTSRQ